ncbi:piggyBac transposable element-derived protein 4-like [Octopus sinensis]|uniref:PiggyBac transposable element-derived protein 4-like n=1 Tax=Octopus sinensis TaxID=2607531 RepID=A0A6P7TG72_9MOLL|nr:piggyBac transposable element-derived protein 4-like [Octopus sinensis]
MRQNLLEVIGKWTNVEGPVVYKGKWKETDLSELKKFIELIILIGVYKSKHANVTQLWSQEDGHPIFNKIMSRRFQQILQVLRFDDASAERKKRNDDKLEPTREVFEMWNQNLQDGYVPSSCMTVEEQLVSFRGRCPFRVYIPSKPGKYGIKIWVVYDSETSYVWKMQIYTGKDPVKGRETNQGSRVFGDLVRELENTGHNITCDNFFTCLVLARKLLSKKPTLVGTIRKNRVELPSALTNGKKDSMIL